MGIVHEVFTRNPQADTVTITVYSPDESVIKTVTTYRIAPFRKGIGSKIEVDFTGLAADGKITIQNGSDSMPFKQFGGEGGLEEARAYMQSEIWAKWGGSAIYTTEDELRAAGAAYVDSCDTQSYYEYKGLWFAVDETGTHDGAELLAEGRQVEIGIPGATSRMIIPAEGTRYVKPPEEREYIPSRGDGLGGADLPY
jgi:hypothetical protein